MDSGVWNTGPLFTNACIEDIVRSLIAEIFALLIVGRVSFVLR